MAETTNIQWCDSTFNPWIGCTKVSVGPQGACVSCYAEVATPARSMHIAWGPGKPRHRTSPSYWALPLRWERNAAAFQAEHGRRQRVFCASLADVFDNEVDPAWRADLFRLIRQTPNLDWLLLTKRIGNAPEMIDRALTDAHLRTSREPFWPWPNVWLGATVVTQAEADRDIPKLLAVPARVRFLSIEPMLGPIDLTGFIWGRQSPCSQCPQDVDCECGGTPTIELKDEPAISWVIAGGESGSKARPSHPNWFRSLRDQCSAAGVPFFFKQWGAWAPGECNSGLPTRTERVAHWWNGEWHFDSLTPRESSEQHIDDEPDVYRLGKKVTGRRLDGIEHNDSPRIA